MDMEEFLFSYEFPDFVVYSYDIEPLEKKWECTKKIAKNVNYLTWNFEFFQTRTLYIP